MTTARLPVSARAALLRAVAGLAAVRPRAAAGAVVPGLAEALPRVLSARKSAMPIPSLRRAAAPTAPAPCLELNQGDMVMHAAFGRGLVLSVRKMGGDALLEIAFDDIGTKKLMAKTASAHMKKL